MKVATCKEPNVEEVYSGSLISVVRRSLSRAPGTLAQLAKAADGAYPVDIREALDELIEAGEVVYSSGVYTRAVRDRVDGLWRQPLGVRETLRAETGLRLPRPHPADYDWRFTPATAGELARLAVRLAADGRIAVFGAPTLYWRLALDAKKVVLYERNPHIIQALGAQGCDRVVEVDLLRTKNVERETCSVVVADPPWYLEHYRAFITAASSALTMNGVLVISILPRLTRPEAVADRADVLRFALESGFDVCGYQEAKLAYATPDFERASLLSTGIRCGNWRRGDLCVLRLTRRVDTAGFAGLRDDRSEPAWEHFAINGYQVKIQQTEENGDTPFHAEPLGVGGAATLPTVSRRYKRRHLINVWSGLNQAWMVSNVGPVRRVLRRLSQVRDLNTAMSELAGSDTMSRTDLEGLREFMVELVTGAELNKERG